MIEEGLPSTTLRKPASLTQPYGLSPRHIPKRTAGSLAANSHAALGARSPVPPIQSALMAKMATAKGWKMPRFVQPRHTVGRMPQPGRAAHDAAQKPDPRSGLLLRRTMCDRLRSESARCSASTVG
jgi:hypothetical protein